MTRPLDDEFGEALRAELLGWPGVTIRPMMGCMAFVRGKQMLGCYVNRELSKRKPPWMNRPGESPLGWVRLSMDDVARALKRTGVSQCRTGAKNWIEIPLESRAMLAEAVRWFGVAYENPPRTTRKKKPRAATARPRQRR
jgi:hypothetical protein